MSNCSNPKCKCVNCTCGENCTCDGENCNCPPEAKETEKK